MVLDWGKKFLKQVFNSDMVGILMVLQVPTYFRQSISPE